MEILSDLK